MKINTLLPAACLLFAGVQTAQAQQRTCDMAITLVSPAEAAVIGAFAQFNISVNIRNLGPADLIAGDTVYYHTPSMLPFDAESYILTQAIPSGSDATVTLEVVTNTNDNQFDETADYCVKVFSNPQDNGNFIDTTNDMNNFDCNSVTIKAANSTAIDNVIDGKSSIRVYPNPAAAVLNLDPGTAVRDAGSISIRDISGRLLSVTRFDKATAVAGPLHPLQVDIAGLAPGLYLLELQSGSYKAAGKFVKQ